MLEIKTLTKEDFDYIIANLRLFWGFEHDRLLFLHHPIYYYELGDTAFAVKDGDQLAAYLFAFISQKDPKTAYAHLTAIHPDYRALGAAELLYGFWIDYAKSRGCTRVKSLTDPRNLPAIRIHQQLGYTLLGTSEGYEFPVVKDYWGKGGDRVVFVKTLE